MALSHSFRVFFLIKHRVQVLDIVRRLNCIPPNMPSAQVVRTGRSSSKGPSVRSLEPPLPDHAPQANGDDGGHAPIPHHLYRRVPKHMLLPDGTPNYLPMILTARVYDVVQATPLTFATGLSNRLGCKISLKREDLQPVFSFKCRGAYNCIAQLSKADKEKGVVACSAGAKASSISVKPRES